MIFSTGGEMSYEACWITRRINLVLPDWEAPVGGGGDKKDVSGWV